MALLAEKRGDKAIGINLSRTGTDGKKQEQHKKSSLIYRKFTILGYSLFYVTIGKC